MRYRRTICQLEAIWAAVTILFVLIIGDKSAGEQIQAAFQASTRIHWFKLKANQFVDIECDTLSGHTIADARFFL